MSQLALGFQEVIEQNNRMMKEKTKELLLQDMAHSNIASHRDLNTSDFGSEFSWNVWASWVISKTIIFTHEILIPLWPQKED